MIVIKRKRQKIGEIDDEQLEKLLKDAYQAKMDLKAKKKIVQDAQEVIIERAHKEGLVGVGSYLLIADEAKVRVKNSKEVEIEDYVAIKEILERAGLNVDEFVKVDTKVEVKPTKKLIELLADGDSPVGKKIRQLVVIKTNTQVEWVL